MIIFRLCVLVLRLKMNVHSKKIAELSPKKIVITLVKSCRICFAYILLHKVLYIPTMVQHIYLFIFSNMKIHIILFKYLLK